MSDNAGVSPAVLQPGASSNVVGVDELERRQRVLEEKAKEIERRERALQDPNRSGDAETGGKNWPPLPRWCCFRSCFYQSFQEEIPIEVRGVVRTGYYLWMAHMVTFFFNVLGTLSYFIGDDGSTTSATTFGLSIVLFLIFTPAAFICWFRPLYKAFKNDSSFSFFVFFFVIFAQIIVLIIQCLGLNWLASCGWLNGIAMLKKNTVVAGIMMTIAAVFTLLTLLDVVLLIKVHRLYRGQGGSWNKARDEMKRDVASNETVRGVASDVGQAAVSGAVSGAMQSGR